MPLTLWLLIFSAFAAQAQKIAPGLAPNPSPASPAPAAPKPSGPVAISVGDIPDRLRQTAATVRTALQNAAPRDQIVEIERSFPGFAAGLKALLSMGHDILRQERIAPGPLLEDRGTWALATQRLNRWQSQLKARSDSLNSDLLKLRQEAATWTATRESAAAQDLPEDLVAELDRLQQSIGRAEQATLARRNEILKLQGRISEVAIEIDRLEEELRAAATTGRGVLLRLDSPPIWHPPVPVQRSTDAGSSTDRSPEMLEVLRYYVTSLRNALALQLFIWVALALVFRLLRRRSAGWEADDNLTVRALGLAVRRPFSAAFLFSSLLALFVSTGIQEIALGLAWYVMLVPMLRILPALVSRNQRPAVWMLAGVYVAAGATSVLTVHATVTRILVTLTAATAAVALGAAARRLFRNPARGGWIRAALVCMGIGAALLLVSTGAEIVGATILSRYLLGAVLRIAVGSVALYGVTLISRGLAEVALRSSGAVAEPAAGQEPPDVRRRAAPSLHWLAVMPFTALVLNAFQLPALLYLARKAMGQVVTLGSIEFTVGSTVAFAGILIAASMASRLLRLMLLARIYRQIDLQRGTSEAISKLLHYSILTAGFLFALSVAGIDLTKFTVLAGAFGVGIAFGLQNIVNNFVSGLILQFERPLHVGDRITLGDVSGEVKDIGIRASTVATWEGADLVVPNANLISGTLTNWTLSDNRRRSDLRVGVAYGTDPERVLRILKETALRHRLVFRQPEPLALFTAFGESSLDFCLRYWTLADDQVVASNEMHLAVWRRLADEKIEIPFPQRDLNIRNPPADWFRSSGAAGSGG